MIINYVPEKNRSVRSIARPTLQTAISIYYSQWYLFRPESARLRIQNTRLFRETGRFMCQNNVAFSALEEEGDLRNM